MGHTKTEGGLILACGPMYADPWSTALLPVTKTLCSRTLHCVCYKTHSKNQQGESEKHITWHSGIFFLNSCIRLSYRVLEAHAPALEISDLVNEETFTRFMFPISPLFPEIKEWWGTQHLSLRYFGKMKTCWLILTKPRCEKWRRTQYFKIWAGPS